MNSAQKSLIDQDLTSLAHKSLSDLDLPSPGNNCLSLLSDKVRLQRSTTNFDWEQDLSTEPWRATREHTRWLAEELIKVRKELQATALESARTSARMDQLLQDKDRFELSVRLSTEKMSEELTLLRTSLESEILERTTQTSDLLRRFTALEASTCAEFPKLGREISDLRSSCEGPFRQIETLEASLRAQAAECKSGQLSAIEHSKELHFSLAATIQELKVSQEKQKHDSQQALQEQRANVGSALKQIQSELQSSSENATRQIALLKDALKTHSDEWKSGHISIIARSEKMHDTFTASMKEIMLSHEQHKHDLQQSLQDHRGNIDSALQQLQNKMLNSTSELRCSSEDQLSLLTKLKNRMSELASSISTQQKGSEDQFTILTKLKSRVSELACSISAQQKSNDCRHDELQKDIEGARAIQDQETQARQSLANVFEQTLTSEQSKLMDIMTREAASTRSHCNDLQRVLMDLLSKETCERQEQNGRLQDDLKNACDGIGPRLLRVEGECQKLLQASNEAQLVMRNLESRNMKLRSKTDASFRLLRDEVHTAIGKERSQRAMACTAISKHVDCLEDLQKLAQPYPASRAYASETLGDTHLTRTHESWR